MPLTNHLSLDAKAVYDTGSGVHLTSVFYDGKAGRGVCSSFNWDRYSESGSQRMRVFL